MEDEEYRWRVEVEWRVGSVQSSIMVLVEGEEYKVKRGVGGR